MLHLAHKIIGTTVRAQDGELGTLQDLIFEQSRWAVRYLVVDTGSWLNGRRVLLSPMAVEGPWDRAGITMVLRRAQVEHSPDVRLDGPARTDESTLLAHYGQPMYWEGTSVWGMFDTPAALRAATAEELSRSTAAGGLVERLRSTEELKGFHLIASDGEIGHVDDFLLGEQSWCIRYLLVDTSNWIGGRSVLVGTDVVERVDGEARTLRVSDSRADIEASPTYDSIVDSLSPAETGPPFIFL